MFQIQVMGAGGFKHAGQKPAFSQGRQQFECRIFLDGDNRRLIPAA